MREEIRRMFCEYPVREKELRILKFRITNFKGVDADEVIKSMCFSVPQEEKVQTSGPSDKTASTAINYRKVADRLEDELFDGLLDQYRKKKEEMEFFCFGVGSLSGKLPEVIHDMVMEGMEWHELAEKYGVSHSMIGKYRKKALEELEAIYSIREHMETAFMLS